MQIKKYVRIITLILLVSFIASVNLKCLGGCIPWAPLIKHVKIENDIVKSSNQLKGKIGFCGVSITSKAEGYYHSLFLKQTESGTPLTEIVIADQHLVELQSLFLDIIGNRELTDCNYETLKDFNYRKSRPNYPSLFFTNYDFLYPKGYIGIFDEKDENDEWTMFHDSLRFLNEFFICDYYLAGKIYMSYDNETGFYHNLLLVIYNNEGYKVWSKIYKNKYSYDKIKEIKTEDWRENLMNRFNMRYEIIQRLLNDFKAEINNDLDLIIGSGKD
jgi:hypothetical protein